MGLVQARILSCPCACSRNCSGACFWNIWKTHFYKNQLRFSGSIGHLQDAFAFDEIPACATKGANGSFTLAKPPFGGSAARAGVSGPLHASGGHAETIDCSVLEGGHVTFQWKNYRSEHREKIEGHGDRHGRIPARRFPHPYPALPGFQRIRHYGFSGQLLIAQTKLEYRSRSLLMAKAPPDCCPNRLNAFQMKEAITEQLGTSTAARAVSIGSMIRVARNAVLLPLACIAAAGYLMTPETCASRWQRSPRLRQHTPEVCPPSGNKRSLHRCNVVRAAFILLTGPRVTSFPPNGKSLLPPSPSVFRFGIFSASAYKTHNPGHDVAASLVHSTISSTCGPGIRPRPVRPNAPAKVEEIFRSQRFLRLIFDLPLSRLDTDHLTRRHTRISNAGVNRFLDTVCYFPIEGADLHRPYLTVISRPGNVDLR